MKSLWILSALLISSLATAAAADCVQTPRGRTICRDAAGAIVATPTQGAVVAAPTQGAVVATPTQGAVAVVPHTTAVVAGQGYQQGVTTAQGVNGGKAAYNPNTGNAAV